LKVFLNPYANKGMGTELDCIAGGRTFICTEFDCSADGGTFICTGIGRGNFGVSFTS
jgi:hypothetical protein